MSRPDPIENSENDEPLFALEHGSQHADVASLASKLAEHVGSADVADLALDLVLNEIVEQARLATTATGAAIALLRDDEMVCRATSGSNAPDLGVRLSMRSGLSGACLRTRQVQRCDDTQTDSRVNGVALRNLDVRSILVVPILNREEMAGVFEILSPRPSAFGDREVLTLQALSRRIVRNLERAAAPLEPPPVPLAAPQAISPAADETRIPPPPAVPEIFVTQSVPRDYWTTALTAIVIGLALLLGWMVGYAGWQRATTSPENFPAARSTASTPEAPSPAVQDRPPVASAPVKKAKTAAIAARKSSVDDAPAPGGLVVYRNGKVVFEMTPAETAAAKLKPAGGGDGPHLMTLSPEVAETYLLRRVEAEYPAAAQSSQALGPVVLAVQVGKDGSVQQASLVSGDPVLVPAAVAAVRQWKYQPYAPEGIPMDFSTQVSVNFNAK
jgi:TonB family protein